MMPIESSVGFSTKARSMPLSKAKTGNQLEKALGSYRRSTAAIRWTQKALLLQEIVRSHRRVSMQSGDRPHHGTDQGVLSPIIRQRLQLLCASRLRSIQNG